MGSPHGAPPPDPAPVVPEPEPAPVVSEPVPAPAPVVAEPEPEVPEVDDEDDVPVARGSALIEEALNATLAPTSSAASE